MRELRDLALVLLEMRGAHAAAHDAHLVEHEAGQLGAERRPRVVARAALQQRAEFALQPPLLARVELAVREQPLVVVERAAALVEFALEPIERRRCAVAQLRLRQRVGAAVRRAGHFRAGQFEEVGARGLGKALRGESERVARAAALERAFDQRAVHRLLQERRHLVHADGADLLHAAALEVLERRPLGPALDGARERAVQAATPVVAAAAPQRRPRARDGGQRLLALGGCGGALRLVAPRPLATGARIGHGFSVRWLCGARGSRGGRAWRRSIVASGDAISMDVRRRTRLQAPTGGPRAAC